MVDWAYVNGIADENDYDFETDGPADGSIVGDEEIESFPWICNCDVCKKDRS